MKLQPR